MTDFSNRLANRTDLELLREDLLTTTSQALEPSEIELWVR